MSHIWSQNPTGVGLVLQKCPLWGPWWQSGEESAHECRARMFNPWSGKSPHATEQRSPCTITMEARTLEPGSCSYWAHVPWGLCTEVGKPLWREACAPRHKVAPTQCDLGKPVHSNGDPVQPKEKETCLKKKKSSFSPFPDGVQIRNRPIPLWLLSPEFWGTWMDGGSVVH